MPEDYDWRVVPETRYIKRYGEVLASFIDGEVLATIVKEWWQASYPIPPKAIIRRADLSRFDEPLCSERCGYKFWGVGLHSPWKGKVYAYCILLCRGGSFVRTRYYWDPDTFWYRYVGEAAEGDGVGDVSLSELLLKNNVEIPRSELETMLGIELKPCPPRSEASTK
jgi:hypothetical protein